VAPDKITRVRSRKLPVKRPANQEISQNTTSGRTPLEGDRRANADAAIPSARELAASLTDCVRRASRGELSPHRFSLIVLAFAERSRLQNTQRKGHTASIEELLACEEILATGLHAAEGAPSEGNLRANAGTPIPSEGEVVALLLDCVRRMSLGELSPYRLELITLALGECCRPLNGQREGLPPSAEDQLTCRHLLVTGLHRQQYEQWLKEAGPE